MSKKWSAYWITGISALLLLGAIGIKLEKPQKELEITVLTEPAITEMTLSESTQRTILPVTTAVQHQPVTTEPKPETEPPVTAPPEYNLNRATVIDLKRVDGIGDTLAEAIIAKRTALGGFTSRMELCEIDGIGEELMLRVMAEFEIPDEIAQSEPISPAPEYTDAPEILPEEPVYYNKTYDANTVTREELLTLPDMTVEMADAILTMRSNLKGYHGIYEISLAEGVPGDYFEYTLKQYLYIVGDPYSVAPASNP